MRTKSAGTMAGLLTFALPCITASMPASHKPAPDAVPDARMAIRMAIAICEPLHGATRMTDKKSFSAPPALAVWTRLGSLQTGLIGGVAEARIFAGDGGPFVSSMDSEPREASCAHA